jgi:hypothetical protein
MGGHIAWNEAHQVVSDHRGFSELLGGLRAWQPQKLYYFSDADDPSFLRGKGPSYPVTEVSATRRVEYFRLWLTMAHLYSTQYDNLSAADGDVPPSRQVLIPLPSG